MCCSSKYALRPYLYILLHWPVAKAFSMVAGTSAAELYGFYGTRAVLSLASLVLEARLIKCAPGTKLKQYHLIVQYRWVQLLFRI